MKWYNLINCAIAWNLGVMIATYFTGCSFESAIKTVANTFLFAIWMAILAYLYERKSKHE